MPFAGYMKPVLLCLACALCIASRGQAPGPLADSLKKDAVAVMRTDETAIEILSPKKARVHYRHCYTILNSQGDIYAAMYVFYDKFNKLNSISGALYDADGKLLKKIKKNDLEDRSVEGAGTLVTDTRVKYYRFSCRNYPYTVSYEEDIDMDGIFALPAWHPQSSPNIAVENASLVVKAPAGYPLRYKQDHYPGEPVITEKNDDKTYSWQISRLAAAPTELYSPGWLRQTPSVKLAPGNFEIEGYKGNMYSWNDLAAFVRALWKGRDQLPEEAKQKVHALTDGLKDDHEKIRVLYDFLQKNTHYVGIQLGIGGWQPFDAGYVYSKRFGDCKALSNYMVALLKEAGIGGNYVLIRAGIDEPGIDTGFACTQFNHAIVVAHTAHDSVWLECTSQTLPAGYLGGFTADRDALLVGDNGGYIVHTPVYGLHENQLLRVLNGSIDSSGRLVATVHNRYTGMMQDEVHNVVTRFTKKEQLERIQQSLGLQNCTISDISYIETPGPVPVTEESFRLTADNFATRSGSRLFVAPGAFLRKGSVLREAQQPRKNNIVLVGSVQETDSVVIQVPKGYAIEANLPAAKFTAPFGDYYSHSSLKDETLMVTCVFRQKKGEYESSLYPRLARWHELVYKDDTYRIVLVKTR